MRKTLIVFAMSVLSVSDGQAQGSFQNRMLIDAPTAGTLPRGSFAVELRMFGRGGLLSSVAVGITPRFMIGLSYGGENIIGSGDVNFNPSPGIMAAFRVIDENFAAPAVTVGFNSQGHGAYIDGIDRYQIKSRGLYAIASKNYAVFHNFGLHGGLNRSFEDNDNDSELNFFFGLDLSFNREFRFLLEYDLARNDNESEPQFGSGEGYLNAGVQWSFSGRFFIQMNVKDLSRNSADDVNREFRIGYFEYF